MKNFLKVFVNKYKSSDVVFKASIWFVFVTVINNSVSILTQPIINRILTKEEVGVYGVFQTWHSIFLIVATFNLFCGVLEVLITKNKEDSDQIVSSLASLSLCIWLVFFCAIVLFLQPLADLLLLKPSYLIVLALTVVADAVVQFWCVQKRFQYKYRQFAALMIALFFTKSVASIVVAWLLKSDPVLGRVLGLCLPSLGVALVLAVVIFKKGDRKHLSQYWKKGFLYNLPLIPHYLSSVLLSSSDKVMIQHLENDAATGLYTVAYSFSSLCLIIFNAVNSAYTPTALDLIRKEDYDVLSRKTKPIVLVSVIFALLLMIFAPEGLYILGGEEYLDALSIVPTLITGIFFSSFYFIFSNVEFVHEKTKLVFPITFLGAGLNILLNYLLIPRFGYEMAAYTTLISYMVVALCHYLVSVRILKRNIYPIKTICLYLAMLMVGTILMIFLYQVHFLIRYGVILILLTGVAFFAWYWFKKRKTQHNIT